MDNKTQTDFDFYINYLKEKYKKIALTKEELSKELGISQSTINSYIAKGINLPNYKKTTGAKNSRVLFPLIEVAKYLVQTIKVA